MSRAVRDGTGVTLIAVAVIALVYSVVLMRGRDHVASALLLVASLSVLRAGVELLRPALGE